MLRRIARAASKAVSAESAGVYLMSGTRLQPFAAYHMPKPILPSIRNASIVVSDPRRLKTVWSDDVQQDPAFQHPIFRQFPARSLIVTPLRGNQAVIGLLVCAWWTSRRALSRTDVDIVRGIGRQAARAILNAQRYDRAAQQAVEAERIRVDNLLHDTLRRTLFSIGFALERALRPDQSSAAVRSIVREIKDDVRLLMTQANNLMALDAPAVPAAALESERGAAS